MRYVRVSFANRDRCVTYMFLSRIAIVRVGYKRGVVKPEVLGHVHNYGDQIQTLKKKLHKLNASAQYTIIAMSQMTIQHSVYGG